MNVQRKRISFLLNIAFILRYLKFSKYMHKFAAIYTYIESDIDRNQINMYFLVYWEEI